MALPRPARHRPPRELAPGLWQVTDQPPRSPMPRGMVVFRLADGGLLIHGAVAMEEAGMAELEALGPPRVPIVPNGFHRRDAAFYKTRYPDLLVVCPAAARKKAGQAVAVDGAAEQLPPPLGIVCHEPAGVKPFRVDLRIAVRGRAGAGVGGSAFQAGAPAWPRGWIFHRIGSSGFFGMSRIGRWMLLKQPAEFRRWLETMADLPGLIAVCPGHGKPLLDGCAARLRQAAARIG